MIFQHPANSLISNLARLTTCYLAERYHTVDYVLPTALRTEREGFRSVNLKVAKFVRRDGTYNLSSLAEKSKDSNRLQMSLQTHELTYCNARQL